MPTRARSGGGGDPPGGYVVVSNDDGSSNPLTGLEITGYTRTQLTFTSTDPRRRSVIRT
jgi:hypothetical protein